MLILAAGGSSPYLSSVPPPQAPQFGQLVQLSYDVENQVLKVSLGLHTPSGVQISLLYLEFITRNFSKLSIIFKIFKLSKKFQYITIADQNCINFDM